jgi:hypothetical protein
MEHEVYPDRVQELISELRSHLNGVITDKTSKADKIRYGWEALEKLRLIEMAWHGEEDSHE